MKQLRLCIAVWLVFMSLMVNAQSVYFFRDSNNPGYYDTGLAFRTSPSTIEQTGPSGDKIPTQTTAYAGTNSLKLRWTSRPGGDWSALVIAPGFPFQDIRNTDTLAFWAYAPNGLAQNALPVVFMEGAPGTTKSRKYSLANFSGDLPAAIWTQIKIPLSIFLNDPNQTNINFSQIKAIIFGQNVADGVEHTLYIDEVRTYRSTTGVPNSPTNLRAFGYDSHVELRWQSGLGAGTGGYRLYRALGSGDFQFVRSLNAADTLAIDFVRPLGTNLSLRYQLTATNDAGTESAPTAPVEVQTFDMTDEQLLTMVQEYTFRYFWDFGHPVSGLARERNTSGDIVTMGGSGFGVMAILVAIERGFITREQGLQRLLKIVNFLNTADRFHGVFPHWMNGATGRVVPFSPQDNGGDLVETAFLMEGLLTVRQYFNGSSNAENELRTKITTLWEAIEWNWYRNGNRNVLYWHWSPNFNFALNLPVRGFNETHMVYLLALSSPTDSIPANLYQQGWAGSNYRFGGFHYGLQLDVGPRLGGPLFFTHYSYLGFDPRFVRDEYTNYFIRNRNHALIHHAYAIENPRNFRGYSAEGWGLTASDDPLVGYLAHEPGGSNDNGTIAPTAALASMPYTPNESLAALKHFYRNLGARLWGPMGFYDAYNETLDWYATSYLAIDQGPIIGMIENYRTELLWKNFMSDPEIQQGLRRAGFVPDSTLVSTTDLPTLFSKVEIFPNPAKDRVFIHLEQLQSAGVYMELLDSRGQLRQKLSRTQLPPGTHQFEIPTHDLDNGIYFLKIGNNEQYLTRKISIVK
ncbi:MAG: glucoamylase family protein [Saprospiraceae bacterium]